MRDEDVPGHCPARTLFGIGLSIGLVVGVTVGSLVALRVGEDAIDAARGLIGRLSGHSDQVHFELLLQ